jgi:hypothetical protein
MEINEFLHLIAIFAVLLRGTDGAHFRSRDGLPASGRLMETQDESSHPISRADLLHS